MAPHPSSSPKQTAGTTRPAKTPTKTPTETASHAPAGPEHASLQRTVAAPGSASPADLLRLQKSFGNRAVVGLLANRRLQAKLTVGPAHDHYEAEADRMAEKVMSSPTPAAVPPDNGAEALQRQEIYEDAPAGHEQRLAETITPLAQRASPSGAAGFAMEDETEARLNAQRGGGQALPAGTRQYMERGFGADFGRVRVHTGESAVRLSRDLHAQAFTHGSDIYFGANKYNPHSQAGKRLLAHELTHVLQQTGVKRLPAVQRAAAVQRVAAPRVQRAPWYSKVGEKLRAWGQKSWPNIKEGLLRIVGGPIYQLIQVFRKRGTPEADNYFSAKEIKKYWAMLKGESAGQFGAYIGKFPTLLRLIDTFANEVLGIVGWATLWLGLLGFIPGAQALLSVAGVLGSVGVLIAMGRAAINTITDAWSNFLALYRYREIERHADRRTGDLDDTGQALVKPYLAGLGEYQVGKAAFTGAMVGAGLSVVTGGLAGMVAAAPKTAAQSFLGAANPATRVAGLATATRNMAQHGVLSGTSPITMAIGRGASAATGDRLTLNPTQQVAPGKMPTAAQAQAYQPGTFTNLRDIPKAPLTTISGKLRGLLNPITALYQIFMGALAVVRGVVAAVTKAMQLIGKVVQFLSDPVGSIRKLGRWFSEPTGPDNQTGFQRWRSRTAARVRGWWDRNASERRRHPPEMVQASLEPGAASSWLQREPEEERQEDDKEPVVARDDPDRDLVTSGELKTGLQKLATENKAASLVTKLGDITQMLSGARDMVGTAADEAARVERA